MRNESIYLKTIKTKNKKKEYLLFVEKGLRKGKDLSAKDEVKFELLYAKINNPESKTTYDMLIEYSEGLPFPTISKLRNIIRNHLKVNNLDVLDVEFVSKIIEGKCKFIEKEHKNLRKENRHKDRNKVKDNNKEELNMKNKENVKKEEINKEEDQMKKESIYDNLYDDEEEFTEEDVEEIIDEFVDGLEKDTCKKKKFNPFRTIKNGVKKVLSKVRDKFKKVRENFKKKISNGKEVIKNVKEAKKAYKENDFDVVKEKLEVAITTKKQIKFGIIKVFVNVVFHIVKFGIKAENLEAVTE